MFIKVCANKFRMQACSRHASFCSIPWLLPQLNQDKEGSNWVRKWSAGNYFSLNQRETKTLLWLTYNSLLALLGFIPIYIYSTVLISVTVGVRGNCTSNTYSVLAVRSWKSMYVPCPGEGIKCHSYPTSPQSCLSGHGYRMELSTLSCFNPYWEPIHAPIYKLVTQQLWDLVWTF